MSYRLNVSFTNDLSRGNASPFCGIISFKQHFKDEHAGWRGQANPQPPPP